MSHQFQNVFRLGNFVLAVLLVWLLAKTLLQLWQEPVSSIAASLPVLNIERGASSNERVNLQGSLFGVQTSATEQETSPQNQPVAQQVDEIEKTRLNLTLKGTLVTPKNSVALIQKGREIRVLEKGESLSRGVTLHAINDTFVVLKNQGKLEKLMLPGMQTGASSPRGVSQIRSTALSSTQQQKLEDVRRKIKASPLAINRYIRVRTLQRNGKIQSLQLWPRREKAIFEALGFQAGDRLTAINGQSIANIASDMSQWQSMMNLSQAQFTVKRNGVLQTIDVNLQ